MGYSNLRHQLSSFLLPSKPDVNTSYSTRSHHSAVELPPEVWREIISYLPAGRVRKMYSVNRHLFHIVMEMKYRNVAFETRQEIRRNLELLATGLRAQYTNNLRVWPEAIMGSDTVHLTDSELERRKMRISTRFNSLIKRKPTLKPSSSPTRREMFLRVMDGLSRVVSLEVFSSRYHSFVPDFFQLLASRWGSFRNSLVFLHLDIAVEGWCNTSWSPIAVFPHLTELQIVLSRRDLDSDCVAVFRNHVAPFVNSHYNCLQSLQLKSSFYNQMVDSHTLLSELRHLLSLRQLDIHLGTADQWAESSSLRHFLSMHPESLQELSVNFEYSPLLRLANSGNWPTYEFLRVRLPKLRKLRLCLEPFPDPALAFEHFPDSLMSLSLTTLNPSYHMPYAEVERIFSAFSPENTLQNLSIRVKDFTPTLLGLMASKFSHLGELHLEYQRLLPRLAQDFRNELKGHHLEKWTLHHLTAQHSELNLPYLSVSGVYADALRDSIWNLKEINTSSRPCYLPESYRWM